MPSTALIQHIVQFERSMAFRVLYFVSLHIMMTLIADNIKQGVLPHTSSSCPVQLQISISMININDQLHTMHTYEINSHVQPDDIPIE